ncbi:DUF3572 domain-containing protein [Methylocapsa acidiphila]|uniref:DUF3572 domain-containing protein n=1 Tax=Methylocapsa acidiphila TaxID=133552 RepID=UPI00047DCD17|nr:DUF3572 domain-containing protein [Methylocapsa acidiphila]
MENGSSPISRSKSSPLTKEAAESIAIDVLTFIGAERVRLERFMTLSGLTPEGLRAAAEESGFLAAVLDHLAADEPMLLAFAANGGHDPSIVARARERLAPTTDDR